MLKFSTKERFQKKSTYKIERITFKIESECERFYVENTPNKMVIGIIYDESNVIEHSYKRIVVRIEGVARPDIVGRDLERERKLPCKNKDR